MRHEGGTRDMRGGTRPWGRGLKPVNTKGWGQQGLNHFGMLKDC